ncbi:hypothetical protein T02_9967 [Trichinella nativa]|uniref:Uncharacterized protein n=1 Tax=Trichinella nativa TaxID=6335 RepID=A0A0V1KWE4_9BILA|nr:hypothetical protein T02_9967 [Trichinella nativa]
MVEASHVRQAATPSLKQHRYLAEEFILAAPVILYATLSLDKRGGIVSDKQKQLKFSGLNSTGNQSDKGLIYCPEFVGDKVTEEARVTSFAGLRRRFNSAVALLQMATATQVASILIHLVWNCTAAILSSLYHLGFIPDNKIIRTDSCIGTTKGHKNCDASVIVTGFFRCRCAVGRPLEKIGCSSDGGSSRARVQLALQLTTLRERLMTGGNIPCS